MVGPAQTFLLDTNILLAALIAPESLPVDIQTQLSDPANSILFSAASLWEIAIKCSLGREDFNFRPEDIQQLATDTGFTELPVLSSHCHNLTDLPWHHRDPFDRLLVCQAQTIPAYLLTTDGMLAKYSALVRVVTLR
ncbi:type II toxin-antitoxin system VapC family toxin [Parasulfuritortus cantonensis]|uniref:Type II toxin-antitoxin system VapC family toxin n=1 Tax=Parasulfuritortus cantonensis TaxID=2528202 RepID=A0A4R1B908_9PROT|nr:type II toxin-antitoxin system VapC family toxin [Parasulfuritortus cantonensis]TCJ13003.1 type II toxin-antitoxin system VapC family toxin [Parasulfuritortus cantonensis]